MSGHELRSHPVPATIGKTNHRPVGGLPSDALRLGAKALITSAEGVLVIEERHADGTPFWTLPGGGIHPCETLGDCVRREVAEELQCRIRVEDTASLCRYVHRSRPEISLYAVFRGSLLSDPVPNPGEGITDIAWVPRTSPPSNLLSPFRRLFEAPVPDTTN